MTRSKVERMHLLDFPFWLIFIVRVSHQAIPSYYGSWSSQWSVRGERCDVHFGVQSDIPILALESFFDLNHSTVLSPEGLLSGQCEELPQCPAWKTIERNPSRWTQPILRKLRCGKSKNRVMLYCCPEVKTADDTTRIVFPDELPPEENTENLFAIPYNQHPNLHLLPGLNRSDCLSQPLEMPSTRIMGGKKAHLGQYPMVVRLAYKPIDREQERKEDLNQSRDLDDDGFSQQIDFRCGGVLLNDRYVLTAAHCLRDTTHRIYMVRLGELDERSNPDCELTLDEHVMTCADRVVDIPVIESIVHEKFDVPYRQNDIALLRLNTSIKPTDWIRPICLPFDWRPLLRHSPISADPVLVGWGRDDSFQSSETLQQVHLNWYNTSECRSVYGNAYPKSISICESSQFCLGGGEESGRRADACQGDSGGPVLLTDTSSVSNRLAGGNHQREKVYAVGIISFGPWMCGNSYPSVYTSIPAYLDYTGFWITSLPEILVIITLSQLLSHITHFSFM